MKIFATNLSNVNTGATVVDFVSFEIEFLDQIVHIGLCWPNIGSAQIDITYI